MKEFQIKQCKFSRAVDEFRQWRESENRAYFGDYLLNSMKILFGYKPNDYRVISHENKLVHSFIYGID